MLLDTSHLDAQVCGDPQLREELLRLYAQSLVALAPALADTAGLDRRDAAHKLKGASLAIGAFTLARLCEDLEQEAGPDVHGKLPRRGENRPKGSSGEALTRDVARVIEATRRRIEELLGSGHA